METNGYSFSIKDDLENIANSISDEEYINEFIKKINHLDLDMGKRDLLKRLIRGHFKIHHGLKLGLIEADEVGQLFKDLSQTPPAKDNELLKENSNPSPTKPSAVDHPRKKDEGEKPSDKQSPEYKNTRKKKRGGKRKGEGKRNLSKFIDSAEIITHSFPENFKGSLICPCCGRQESSYEINPSTNLYFRRVTPIIPEIHVREKIRCSSCGITLIAKATEEIENKVGSFLPSAVTFSILMRYQYGFPFYRMESMLDYLNPGLDFSDATQWHFTQKIAFELEPLLGCLYRQAANAQWLGVDDAWNRVVSLSKEIKQELKNAQNENDVRTGIETTTLVAHTFSGHSIQLYMTGRNHQSENRAAIIEMRTNPDPLITMSDATNKAKTKVVSPSGSKVIETHCIEHLRTYFEKIAKDYPIESQYFLNEIKKIYINDAQCKEQAFNSIARLAFHQTNSKKIMDDLYTWICSEIKNNPFAEPNGEYYRALNYAKKFWKEFTEFLCVPGVKLDNGEVERGTKTIVRHRNNSKKYLTPNGAHVGDMFMSFINTAILNKINIVEYLEFCITHRKLLQEDPELFLPWNFLETKMEIKSKIKSAPPYKIVSQKKAYDPQNEMFAFYSD